MTIISATGRFAHRLLDRLHGTSLPQPPAAEDSPALVAGRRRYITSALLPNLISHGLGFGIVGTMVGGATDLLTLTSASLTGPIVGGVLGLALGIALALEHGQKFKGTAVIDVDGKKQTVPWYWRENLRNQPEDELRASLSAAGLLGDHIPAGSVTMAKLPGEPDEARLQAWGPGRERLLALAEQRRLVADLGARSHDGKPILQLVNGIGVRELLARNLPVYGIGGQVTDKTHECKVTTANGARDEYSATSYQYTHRQYDYSIQPLTSPDDLDTLPTGQGVPEGMVGVPKDANSWSEPVFSSTQRAVRQFTEHGKVERVQDATEKSIHKPNATPASLLSGLATAPAKRFMIAGGLVGLIVAGATTLPAAACIGAGAALGRIAAGIVARRKLGPDPAAPVSSKLKKLLTVATTVGGAALGLGLALHPGLQLAGLALGLFGGIGANVLLCKGKAGVQWGGCLAAGGMLAGMLGASLPAATLLSEIGLTALGALAGAISTRAQLLNPRT